MLKSRLLGAVGIVAVVGSSVSAQVGRPVGGYEFPRLLLQLGYPLTNGVVVTSLEDNFRDVVVQLAAQETCSNAPDFHPTPIEEMSVHVWLLRPNGGVFTQRGEPSHVNFGNAGCVSNDAQFAFASEPGTEPVALVVSIKGTLTLVPLSVKP